MDVTRSLVAAAAIAIIAVVGYYFWGEYQQSSRRAEAEKRIEGVRAELFDLAKAEPSETNKVTEFCKNIETLLASSLKENSMAIQVGKNCRALGYL